MLGVLVGLKAEARLIRPFFPDAPIAISGATGPGARRGVDRLVSAGATKLLSFGCAAGLAPGSCPGMLIVPDWVYVAGKRHMTDPALSVRFGQALPRVSRNGVLHSDHLVATAGEKDCLYRGTGCEAVDMESGFVALTGLPFAVLRVICDGSNRDLPPAALDVLSAGRISPVRLLKSLFCFPGQIGELISLGRDASVARSAMTAFLPSLPWSG